MNGAHLAMRAAIAVGLVAGTAACDAGESDTLGDEYTAKYMCQQFVKDRLKSPKSADFSGESAEGPGPTWMVVGDVDADNSFGASMRNSYTCTVRFAGGDEWRLVDLDLSGN